MQAFKRLKPPGSGRQRGTPNKTTSELRETARAHTHEAIEVLIGLMKSSRNDMTRLRAAQELLDRGYGRASRELAEPISLLGDGSLAAKAEAVMVAIASGEITVGQGGQLINTLANVAKIHEVDELERRLSVLEGRQGKADATP